MFIKFYPVLVSFLTKMIMYTMKKSELISIGLVILQFMIGIYLYQSMPEKMASHWGFGGQVDGYQSKVWGLFLMPLFSTAVFLLFLVIPKIDPLKKNIEKFRKYYDSFIVLFVLFFSYVYFLTLAWNLEMRFNMSQALIPAFGILFYYVGILTENAQRNWSIGIRTPWTLSNEEVWKKTHKLGGKLFKVCGIIAFVDLVFPSYEIWFILLPVILAGIYAVAYSYFEYNKETKAPSRKSRAR